MTSATQIIPATPGQVVIVLSTSKRYTHISTKPLVAWQVTIQDEASSSSLPIPAGQRSYSDELFVVLDDGVHCLDEDGGIQTVADVYAMAGGSGNEVGMSTSFELLMDGFANVVSHKTNQN